MNLLKILSRFYYLNPRWLYLAVTLVLLVPLFFNIPQPAVEISRGPAGLYKAIGECPPDKIVLIESSWDLGSKPECMAQLECIVNDLCKRKIKFVVFSTNQFAPTFAEGVILPIVKKAGYEYGKDWVNLGFIKAPNDNMQILLDAFYRDIHKTRPQDLHGTPVGEIPLMQRVKTAADVHLGISINYSPPPDIWSTIKIQHKVPFAFGAASIMAPYYYSFLDSGQMSGLLGGNRGASEYERLSGIPGMGGKVMMSFAFGLCFMIVIVLLGNLGFWAAAQVRRKT